MSWLSQQTEETDIQAQLEAGEALCDPQGEEIQRLSVIQNLPDLLHTDGALCMTRIVPKVQLQLPHATAEFHMAASSTFLTILEKKLVNPRTFTQTFLQSILTSIDSRDPVVASAWLETLLDVMQLLPAEVIRTDIMPVAIAKSQLSQNVQSRIMSCKLIGKMSTRFDSVSVRKELLQTVQSLCQDVNASVRANICSQLPFIAKALGSSEAVKTSLLPNLVELASDEEQSVRLVAVETIVDVLPYFQPETSKFTIVPLVKKVCSQSLSVEDEVLVAVAKNLGKLCIGLEAYLSVQEKQWFVVFYQQISQLGLPGTKRDASKREANFLDVMGSTDHTDRYIKCRQFCAFNFPAMAKFSISRKENFNEHLYSTFCDLSSDPYFLVRRTIACGFHEVARVLGNNGGMIKSEFVKLLKDDAEEVLQGLIPNISVTLEQFSKIGIIGPEVMDSATMEIGKAILKCENEISEIHNWRLHSAMLSQLECLPLCMPADFINNHFTPVMFSRVHNARPLPCRLAAVRTLLVFLRQNTKNAQRNDIRARLISELCNGRSCYSRMLFVRMCRIAMDLFSSKFFKSNFFFNLVELADDKVPNIRLQVIQLFPKLKLMIHMPADRKFLQAIETSIRKLLGHEKDRDVVSQLNRTIQDLDKIDTSSEFISEADHKKFEEEQKILTGHCDKRPTADKGGVRPALPGVSLGPKRSFTNRTIEIKTQRPTLTTANPPSPRPAVRRELKDVKSIKGPMGSIVASSPNTKIVRSVAPSFEDEFYVDAGVKMPHEMGSSADFAPLPTRIPNLREILFKNRNESLCANLRNESISAQNSVSDTFTSRTSSISPESNLSFNLSESSDALHSNSENSSSRRSEEVASKPCTSQSVAVRRPATAASINKRRSGNFSEKPFLHSARARVNTQEKPKDGMVNRRHSYMDGEKQSKVSGSLSIRGNEIPVLRKSHTLGENRRHSYIEKSQSSDVDRGKTNQRKSLSLVQATNPKKNDGTNNISMKTSNSVLNKNSLISSNSENINIKNLDGINSRRSLNFAQNQIFLKNSRRISSLDRCGDSEVQEPEKINIITESGKHLALLGEIRRRHSSLERSDLERLKGPTVLAYRQSLFANRAIRTANNSPQKEMSAGEQGLYSDFPSRESNVEEGRLMNISAKQKDDALGDNLNTIEEGESMLQNMYIGELRQSRIPRGPTSCHSSPGGSRASSPTNLVTLRGTRMRQRTAPNSRAASPTNNGRKRLSLGSLSCYMTASKLPEPGSRLPIRKQP